MIIVVCLCALSTLQELKQACIYNTEYLLLSLRYGLYNNVYGVYTTSMLTVHQHEHVTLFVFLCSHANLVLFYVD